MKIELETPFKELWKKGYLRQENKTNRRRVDLVNNSKDRTTVSFARYLVCVARGSLLPEGYEVDHIDKDCGNDALDNLQVLSVEEHTEKTRKEVTTGRTVVILTCPNCFKDFKREKRNVKPNTIPKCSRKCNAQFNIKNRGWGKQKVVVTGSNPVCRTNFDM